MLINRWDYYNVIDTKTGLSYYQGEDKNFDLTVCFKIEMIIFNGKVKTALINLTGSIMELNTSR
jgi:hypothetical protein